MMKIYGQFSDPTNGPLNGHKHKLECKLALDTIRLKNDDLYEPHVTFDYLLNNSEGIALFSGTIFGLLG